MKKLKFVVVGYGGMGGWHVNMLSGVYGPQLDPAFFEFGGIYDIDPAKTKLAQEKDTMHIRRLKHFWLTKA